MGNSNGSYRSSRENSYRAFDKLPPTARAALANAVFDWAPQPVVTMWQRGQKGMKTGAEIAKSVEIWDTVAIAKDSKRVWGFERDQQPRRKAK